VVIFENQLLNLGGPLDVIDHGAGKSLQSHTKIEFTHYCRRHLWNLPAEENRRGAALITVLFIMALAVMIIVSLVARQEIDIRRTSNFIHADQMELYGDSVLEWGRVLLSADGADKQDNLSEDWAQGLTRTMLDRAVVSGTITDLQGRFNINNLLAADKDLRHFSREQFSRMLTGCQASPGVMDAILDWLDSDQNRRRPSGAEDLFYEREYPPRRSADRALVSPATLSGIAGINASDSRCLQRYICALPEESFVNINTTSPFVLAAADSHFTLEDAEEVLAQRPARGFTSVSAFFQMKKVREKHFFDPFLTVKSNYFQGMARVEMEDFSQKIFVVYRRSTGRVEVIRRWRTL